MDAAAPDLLEIVRAHMAAEDRQDVEAILATFTDECWYRVPGLRLELRGKAEIRRWYEGLYAGVPDFHNEDEHYWLADQTVFFEARAAGTHLGDWLGWAPTGRSFSTGMLCRIPIAADGLMEAEVVYLDGADIFRQLGILPRPASREERTLRALHRARTAVSARLTARGRRAAR
jgi:steroid delta-isomerase-like uncharacterized protein